MTLALSALAASICTSERVAPLDLEPQDVRRWHQLMERTPSLQRAFLTPEFAQATQRAAEQTGGQVEVLIFRHNGAALAFFPFQFASGWHKRLRAAERIGEPVADHTGLIAVPEFRIDLRTLLQAANLSELYVHHLSESQSAFGLRADRYRIGHVIDLTGGVDAYFAELSATRKSFVQDTMRRMRKAELAYPGLQFSFETTPHRTAVAQVLALKRNQYARTGVKDVFSDDPRAAAIIDAILEYPSAACQPVVARLGTDEYTLAWHLGLLSNGVLSYWFPVYDPDAHALSPGRLLLWKTINAATSLGICLIDRGVGDSVAKRDFSNRTQQFGEFAVYGRGMRAITARASRSLAWRLRTLPRT